MVETNQDPAGAEEETQAVASEPVVPKRSRLVSVAALVRPGGRMILAVSAPRGEGRRWLSEIRDGRMLARMSPFVDQEGEDAARRGMSAFSFSCERKRDGSFPREYDGTLADFQTLENSLVPLPEMHLLAVPLSLQAVGDVFVLEEEMEKEVHLLGCIGPVMGSERGMGELDSFSIEVAESPREAPPSTAKEETPSVDSGPDR